MGQKWIAHSVALKIGMSSNLEKWLGCRLRPEITTGNNFKDLNCDHIVLGVLAEDGLQQTTHLCFVMFHLCKCFPLDNFALSVLNTKLMITLGGWDRGDF